MAAIFDAMRASSSEGGGGVATGTGALGGGGGGGSTGVVMVGFGVVFGDDVPVEPFLDNLEDDNRRNMRCLPRQKTRFGSRGVKLYAVN